MEDNKKIARLLTGVYRFFNSKFPSSNYNIHASIDKYGYHMKYLDVDYNFNFEYKGSLLNPRGGGISFKLKVILPKKQENLEARLNNVKISNNQLSGYLADQIIEFNSEVINISCRIKKIPTEENEINNLCSQIWANILKRAFLEIHKF